MYLIIIYKKSYRLNNSGFSFKDIDQVKTQTNDPISISNDSLLS